MAQSSKAQSDKMIQSDEERSKQQALLDILDAECEKEKVRGGG